MEHGVCGTTAEPDEQISPAALAIAAEYLQERNVPKRPKFTPSHLAMDLGGTTRTWQRRFEAGEITGVREGRGYVTVWVWLVRYYAVRQNVVSMN
ncbi:MAG TPA: hypothetical protein VK504_17460 [Vicinamibacterales bacterium]|nr:hypothetical protein [Vicinamibacterales bacterium]